ncbi:MAG: TPD domain-containing protein, partial [archaeon]|nr:TPD domain-containing protein [archaeon]
LEKKMQIEAARLAATERKEITRLAQVELEKKMQIKKSIKKQKDGFWVKIFNKLISLIPKKRKKLPKSRQQTEGLKSTISEKKEVPHEKEEIQVEGETESVIDEIEEEVRIEEAFDDLDWEEEIQVEEEKEPVIDEIEEEFDELDWEEEIVPTIESGEVILAELRIAMRTEPSPINYIINMLTNKHDLSIQNAKYIINHIVSPISICKMLTDEQFDDFIQSLDKNNSDISKGGEIWTQVIQIIGLSSLTMDARVDIYNILSDGKNQNKISKRVITIALLLNALPINFKHWWSMDIFSLEVIEHYGKANKFFRNKKFPQEAIEEARMLICSYAIEKPKSISAEYNYAKQISGNEHENKTEKWLKGSLKDVRYITEKQIQTYRDKHYGNKYINQKITPDILLEIPIQLSAHSQPIHWIDAKNHFVDPALSSDENVQSICHQMNKYVRAYGPGLIVWGRNFSEEWNDATKGAVQHIKV